jgi:ATP-dependent Lhr-like helicase
MSLPVSNSDMDPFLLLDEGIQRWIWSRDWKSLRAVQARAIPALLRRDHDVILAAATSAGKTEAAFFPILTNLLQSKPDEGMVLSISPLKALINDQEGRLRDICEDLDIPVLGWHGDVSASRKQSFLRKLSGVLIITPESLEAFFVNRGTAVPAIAGKIRYVVIDELHSFIGSERGKQVQSLLMRLELAAGKPIPRVGLSATLGDMSLAAEFLRPSNTKEIEIIDAANEPWSLKLLVKGYVDDFRVLDKVRLAVQDDPPDPLDTKLFFHEETDIEEEESDGAAKVAIAGYLYEHLRGSNNLVFPNSRSNVEHFTDLLRRRCEAEGFPNEFWAHHGSLSRELREETEQALKNGGIAATAVCTTTLELGIDIGSIRSVAQIGAPPSVASLRQRLGRSGRRPGESAILRCFCTEDKLNADSPFSDRIREGLLQTVAMVRLLLKNWVEPPRRDALHASTLVQQTLSMIAQHGGSTASELWRTLIGSGTFGLITKQDLVELLSNLGAKDILLQESSGLLLPGVLGEKLINSYDFYSAFVSDEEFRLVADGRTLGSLPVSRPLAKGQRVIFGGRRWRVIDVDTQAKVIVATADRDGAPPAFDGAGAMVHGQVRHEMQLVLSESDPINFLDETGSKLLEEARHYYRGSNIGIKPWFIEGKTIVMPTWQSDWINDALALLLTAKGLQTSNEGVALQVHSAELPALERCLREIAELDPISPDHLRLRPEQTIRQKWDWSLPESLRQKSFVSSALDLEGAKTFALERTLLIRP